MIHIITIAEYYKSYNTLPVIDVRSPGEFQKGHMPGAVNISLFSNDERAQVGTVYVQQSKEKALELGYKFVNPKLDYFLKASKKISQDGEVTVHCWRGGMRSKAFAQHLSENGFDNVYVVKGGYKAFRNYVLSYFDQTFKLRIIGGFTGSGKTHILKVLQKKGEQVIDLEGIANHKGSAFGSIGEKEQPTVEHFENRLFAAFNLLNINHPIWIEDESLNIGYVKMPKNLFDQIREQQLCFIDIPREERAKLLVKDYAQFGNNTLAESIQKIAKRLGGQNVKAALNYLEKNDYGQVAIIVLQYYDKVYTKGLNHRDPKKVYRLTLSDTNPVNNANSVLNHFNTYEQYQTHTI